MDFAHGEMLSGFGLFGNDEGLLLTVLINSLDLAIMVSRLVLMCCFLFLHISLALYFSVLLFVSL
jgi:hypothetical protein